MQPSLAFACGLALWSSGSAQADGPHLVFPENHAVGQPVEITLSWGQGAPTNRIRNGSFESGPNNWTLFSPWRVIVSAEPAAGQRVAEIGSCDSRFFVESHLSQPITLPATGVSATLSWMDWTAGATAAPRFSVEIAGAGVPLQVVHDVSVQDSHGAPWTRHEVDLGSWLGKSFSVAFWLTNPTRAACHVSLDDVRVVVEPVAVSYEVFVGRQPTLSAADLQGTTSSLDWTLSGLQPGTTNFWTVHQISDGRREPGPVYPFVVGGTYLGPPQVRLEAAAGVLELRFTTLPGIRYHAESTPISTPLTWEDTGPEAVGGGAEGVLPVSTGDEGRWIRLRAYR